MPLLAGPGVVLSIFVGGIGPDRAYAKKALCLSGFSRSCYDGGISRSAAANGDIHTRNLIGATSAFETNASLVSEHSRHGHHRPAWCLLLRSTRPASTLFEVVVGREIHREIDQGHGKHAPGSASFRCSSCCSLPSSSCSS